MNNAIKKLAIIGSMMAIVVLIEVARRESSRPDLARTLKMRGALSVKRLAYSQVDFWSSVGSRASTAYNKARL